MEVSELDNAQSLNLAEVTLPTMTAESAGETARETAGYRCTVAIPAFNRADLIGPAIESALANPRSDLQVLVIDNASEDDTVAVAQSYADKDPRLKVVVNERNLGLFGNFNRCLQLAEGDYICILCSDDRLTADFLEEGIRLMDANPDCGLITSPAIVIDQQGNELRMQANHMQPGIYLGTDAIYNFCWFHAHFAFNVLNCPSGALIRRLAIQNMAHFPLDMKIVGDVEFFSRLLEKTNLIQAKDPGCYTMQHPGQEVYQIYDDPSRIYEHYAILERYRDLMGSSFRRCLAAEGAVNTALGIKFWRMGWKPTAKAHFDAVNSKGIGKFGQFWALGRLFVYRMLFKFGGIRFIPKKPIRSLESPS